MPTSEARHQGGHHETADPHPRTVPAGPGTGGARDRRPGLAAPGPGPHHARGDVQCPFCRPFDMSSGDAERTMAAEGLISLVVHPMDFLDQASTNHYSSRAASASGCASDAAGFGEYAQMLFENRPPEGGPGQTDEQLVELGVALGLTEPVFVRCVPQHVYVPRADYVTQRALARGVSGTPPPWSTGCRCRPMRGRSLWRWRRSCADAGRPAALRSRRRPRGPARRRCSGRVPAGTSLRPPPPPSGSAGTRSSSSGQSRWSSPTWWWCRKPPISSRWSATTRAAGRRPCHRADERRSQPELPPEAEWTATISRVSTPGAAVLIGAPVGRDAWRNPPDLGTVAAYAQVVVAAPPVLPALHRHESSRRRDRRAPRRLPDRLRAGVGVGAGAGHGLRPLRRSRPGSAPNRTRRRPVRALLPAGPRAGCAHGDLRDEPWEHHLAGLPHRPRLPGRSQRDPRRTGSRCSWTATARASSDHLRATARGADPAGAYLIGPFAQMARPPACL